MSKPICFTVEKDCVEVTHQIPSRWEICDQCQGEGKRDHPAFSNGITSSEWNDEWEDEEREAYLGGRYDVACECDHGRVLVPDEDACNKDILNLYYEHLREERSYEAERESERRMGA